MRNHVHKQRLLLDRPDTIARYRLDVAASHA
jgi:hypothetical protein